MKPAVFAVLLLLTFGVIWTPAQAVPPGCTEIGTPDRDAMAGTDGPDKLCTLGGPDYVHAGPGNDTIIGGADNDTLVGGPGRDVLRGGPGHDRLFSIDSRPGDVTKGRSGSDHCYVDDGDRVRGCEDVNRVGTSAAVDATIQALSNALFGLAVLGEDAQEEVAELIVIIENFPARCPPPAPSPPPCP